MNPFSTLPNAAGGRFVIAAVTQPLMVHTHKVYLPPRIDLITSIGEISAASVTGLSPFLIYFTHSFTPRLNFLLSAFATFFTNFKHFFVKSASASGWAIGDTTSGYFATIFISSAFDILSELLFYPCPSSSFLSSLFSAFCVEVQHAFVYYLS